MATRSRSSGRSRSRCCPTTGSSSSRAGARAAAATSSARAARSAAWTWAAAWRPGSGGLCDEPVPEARRAGLALLSIPAGAVWGQVLALVQSTIGAGAEVSGIEAGDLFAVANVVAATVDSPVTIEDPDLRVLAYSG